MIFIDTSVWVRAFRSGRSDVARHLADLLDSGRVALSVIARLEVLVGASGRNRAAVRRGLSALPTYRPHAETWARVEEWVATASGAGERFGVADLVVAGVAADQGAALWTLDKDFERMQALGFVQLYGG